MTKAFSLALKQKMVERHSAIRYVTPDRRYRGRERAVLAERHNLYQRMRRAYPPRWSGVTRNWLPVGSVVLNPERTPARQLS
jgi:putative transposase